MLHARSAVAIVLLLFASSAIAQPSEEEEEVLMPLPDAPEVEPAAPAPVNAPEDVELPPRPAQQLSYSNLVGARYNPIGLTNAFHAVYKFRLYESDSLALENNYAGPTFDATLSPAFAKLGGGIEIQPASFLQLYARYEWYPHFGSFDRLLSFPGPQGEYSDDDVSDGGDRGDNYAVWDAHMITLGALVQLKYGNVALRSRTLVMYANFGLKDGDTVWLENQFDVLPPADGWFVHNDTDLLYLFDFNFIAGLRYSITQSLYTDALLDETNGGDDPNPTNQRLGLFLAYTFYKDPPGTAFNNPTVLLLANWYLSHRYRTGQEVSQGLPLIAIAFLFTGDLYTVP